MSIKSLAVFSLVSALLAPLVLFGAELPSPSATPSAAASPSPAAKPKEQKKPESHSPTPTPGPRAIIDGLSQGDLNDAMDLLKSNYVNPAALSDQEMSRATLQGLLDRLAPGISIFSQPPQIPEAAPTFTEILDGRIGYFRLGSLSKTNLDELDVALQEFNGKALKSMVLDLRATPESSDFDMAGEVIKRFCPKGKVLFTVKKTGAKQERIVTSNQDPSFQGILIVMADKDTAGAGEVVAAVLRLYTKAMVIGHTTAGEAVEFSDLPLHSGKILRVAVAEVVPPGNVSIFPDGVKPDLAVEMPVADKLEIFKRSREKGGMGPFVFETERVHLNEAALVAGRNPEIDAIEAAQRTKAAGEHTKVPLRDVVLQRAVDFVTSIGIYESKPGEAAK